MSITVWPKIMKYEDVRASFNVLISIHEEDHRTDNQYIIYYDTEHNEITSGWIRTNKSCKFNINYKMNMKDARVMSKEKYAEIVCNLTKEIKKEMIQKQLVNMEQDFE